MMIARVVRTRLLINSSARRLYSTEISKQPPTPHSQAPNRVETWSTSQRPRPGPESNARFEQTDMVLQPNPLSAQALLEQEPIRVVHGRRAVCDGGEYNYKCVGHAQSNYLACYRRRTSWAP